MQQEKQHNSKRKRTKRNFKGLTDKFFFIQVNWKFDRRQWILWFNFKFSFIVKKFTLLSFLVKKINNEESFRIKRLEYHIAYECIEECILSGEEKINKIAKSIQSINSDREENKSKMNKILESLNKYNSYYDRKRSKKERKKI